MILARAAAAFDPAERRRLLALGGIIAAIHGAGLAALLTYAARDPAFAALGGLAYSFGLRHAFDADHISAVDNVTRKLLQQRRRPVAVGFFFSIGHSTVVLLLSLALAFAAKTVLEAVVGAEGEGGTLRSAGALIGTGVSGAFLVLIGAFNLAVLLEVVRVYRRMRRGDYDREGLQAELTGGGFMTRIFGRLFAFVSESWHMYPVGFLFGLGFDTASEVALLAISAGAAAQGLPFLAVVSLPLLFAAGMSLMDTADGAFMSKAYGWAFSSPVRKIFYNMTVTALSVFVALFVGAVEIAQLVVGKLGLEGQPWQALADLDFAGLGYVIVGSFVLTWVVAFAAYRVGRIEERWEARLREGGLGR